jgi:acyl dehydratase
MGIAATSGFFEDFAVGQRLRSAQGKTVGEEHRTLTHLWMNGVQLHFNADFCANDAFVREKFEGKIIVYGGYVLSVVRGLASGDTSERALAESFANGRHLKPIFEGDTLYAESEVLETRPAPERGGGLVRFKLLGKNQKGETVLEIEREVLLPRRG